MNTSEEVFPCKKPILHKAFFYPLFGSPAGGMISFVTIYKYLYAFSPLQWVGNDLLEDLM